MLACNHRARRHAIIHVAGVFVLHGSIVSILSIVIIIIIIMAKIVIIVVAVPHGGVDQTRSTRTA